MFLGPDTNRNRVTGKPWNGSNAGKMFREMIESMLVEQAVCYILGLGDGKDFEVSIDHLSKLFGFAHVSDFEERFERIYAIKPGKYQQIMKTVKMGEIND